MMLPILISVSEAPGSYFFCASAPLVVATKTVKATDTTLKRQCIARMFVSLVRLNVSIIFDWEHYAPITANTLREILATKCAFANGSVGVSFSRNH
jgi:hypothetical protein